jgi:hypothetical protein
MFEPLSLFQQHCLFFTLYSVRQIRGHPYNVPLQAWSAEVSQSKSSHIKVVIRVAGLLVVVTICQALLHKCTYVDSWNPATLKTIFPHFINEETKQEKR